MRHRRTRRIRRDSYGSYAHHGWYGRDKKKSKKKRKKSDWNRFVEANKHLSQFRLRNGLLNFKKLSLAYHGKIKYKGKGSKKRKITEKHRASRSAFLARLAGLKTAIGNIGRKPRTHRKTMHHKKRTMSAVMKLKAAERALKQASKMLKSAEKRVALAAWRKSEKARKKAEAEAKKPQTPEQAAKTAKAAEKAQKEAVAAAYASSQKGAERFYQTPFVGFGTHSIFGSDPGRKRKGKGKRKGASKRKGGKRHMTRAHKAKLKAGLKRYRRLVRSFQRKGFSYKQALKKASAQNKKKRGRDMDFGHDFLLV